MLTLARISPRNIYLNLFGEAHFHWRSLKACNIAKRTCSSYIWTVIFPWSYCSLKLQILRLFTQYNFRYYSRSSKTIECRFTLKRQNQQPEVFCKKFVFINFAKFTGKHLCQGLFFNKAPDLRPIVLLKKRLWHRRFPVNFTKFLRTPFLQCTSWRLLLTRTWHNNNIQLGSVYNYVSSRLTAIWPLTWNPPTHPSLTARVNLLF